MKASIEAGVSSGVAGLVLKDAKAMAMLPADAAVRAARGARNSLRTQIRSRFKRRAYAGGRAFADTLPAIRQKPEDFGNGRYGARVRTKAWFAKRRSVGFDLFWMFDNAPRMIASGRGRMLAMPLPPIMNARVGRGATRKIPWPRDLTHQGWRTSIIPGDRTKGGDPVIMGGPPGTPRSQWKPLYVLKQTVTVRKKLAVGETGKRYGARLPKYLEQAQKRFERRIATKARTIIV